jgi:alkanesulfonate monooxygenase SsuD/methylene tetrahydromethanopterin reductase-like flavin-dependent oxidoreductase (luciferase family)
VINEENTIWPNYPQGWRGGDLPLEQENDPAKQFAFSKEIAITADNLGFDSIYAYDHKQFQHSVVLPCIITESEEEINQILARYKRDDKTIKQYLDYLVGGITIGVPEKITKGLNEYIELGVTHFILHFIGLNNSVLKLFRSKVVNKL